MGKCELCNKEGSRLQANHKKHGKIMVCKECWTKVKEKGQKICEGTGSESSGIGGGCPTCR